MTNKIAIIIYSNSFNNEDRLRKECITLSKFASLKIFVVCPDNSVKEGITSYGTPYITIKLKTRDILPNSRFLFIKMIEFYIRLKPLLREYNFFWAHDEPTFLFPLFGKKNKFIWDLHEIPTHFLRLPMKYVFTFIERRCIKIIHANDYRKNYLILNNVIKNEAKHLTLRNYPDIHYISYESNSSLLRIQEWLAGKQYVYVQGLSSLDRYPYNTIASILEATDFKILVAGGFLNSEFERLELKYGSIIEERVNFMGMIDLFETSVLLRNSTFSIVLYNGNSINNRFCEPNRLFQAIGAKIPVITGCNKPMTSIVIPDKIGVTLSSYGDDINEIINAINNLMSRYEYFKENCINNNNMYVWQDTMIDPQWFGVNLTD